MKSRAMRTSAATPQTSVTNGGMRHDGRSTAQASRCGSVAVRTPDSAFGYVRGVLPARHSDTSGLSRCPRDSWPGGYEGDLRRYHVSVARDLLNEQRGDGVEPSDSVTRWPFPVLEPGGRADILRLRILAVPIY